LGVFAGKVIHPCWVVMANIDLQAANCSKMSVLYN